MLALRYINGARALYWPGSAAGVAREAGNKAVDVHVDVREGRRRTRNRRPLLNGPGWARQRSLPGRRLVNDEWHAARNIAAK